MDVTLIVTVKNEGQSIHRLLESISHQSRPPEEIVICDGGSSDETLQVVDSFKKELPIKAVSFPGSNISQGRNRAISEAAGPIICSTDAGVRLAPEWLQELVRPIEVDGAPVASGWFEPDPQTEFEVAMGATVLPALNDINPVQFLPSSRSVAYLKSAWEEVGGYPEWLDYGEDLIFDLKLREKYGPFPFAPKAVAYFRPRGDLTAFARQYYRYGRGDGKAGLWPKRHAVRFLTYMLGLPIILWFISQGRWYGWALLTGGGAIYCRRPFQRLSLSTRKWRPASKIRSLVLIPVIRVVGDLAKMAGYLAGINWRRRYRQ